MNEDMKVSRHALLLLASYEGKPRLKARRCEGGRWELSYGCTTWPDGRPVGPADECTEDQALQLFAFHLHRFEAIVEKYTTVALNQFQYDALVCLAYNIGEGQFKTCSALRHMNEKNWEEAAASFGMYVFATSSGPSDTQMKMAEHKGQWRINDKGVSEWIGPEGQACSWRQGLDGLLRRHHSEGLLSLGMPWEQTCTRSFIFIDTERHWNPAENRWEDTVLAAREFRDCRAKAELLPRLELAAPTEGATTAPFDLEEYRRRVEAAANGGGKPVDAKKPPAATTPAAGAAKAAPAPSNAPPPAPRAPLEYEVPKGSIAPPVPPQAKRVEATRRFWGLFLVYGGKLFMAFGVSTLPGHLAIAFGNTWGAVVKDPQLFGMAIDALCFSTGFVADHCGGWIKKWGERHAKGPMVTGGERLPPPGGG